MIESARPALLLDLDGTLVDSVYQHVVAGRWATVSGRGGEGGIRTRGGGEATPLFESGTLNHSDTSPGPRRESILRCPGRPGATTR